MLTKETSVALIRAFISSRLDYCNSLLYGISSTLLRRLQSIGLQNAAARLVTGAKKFDDNHTSATSTRTSLAADPPRPPAYRV